MLTGTQMKQKFDVEWGAFRKLLSANPLTGFWIALALGAPIGWMLHGIFGAVFG